MQNIWIPVDNVTVPQFQRGQQSRRPQLPQPTVQRCDPGSAARCRRAAYPRERRGSACWLPAASAALAPSTRPAAHSLMGTPLLEHWGGLGPIDCAALAHCVCDCVVRIGRDAMWTLKKSATQINANECKKKSELHVKSFRSSLRCALSAAEDLDFVEKFDPSGQTSHFA